jgi:hypothetical protein
VRRVGRNSALRREKGSHSVLKSEEVRNCMAMREKGRDRVMRR